MANPWLALSDAKRKAAANDTLIQRLGEQLRDYADAQTRALPDVTRYLKVAAFEHPESRDNIVAIRPDAYDIRFSRDVLEISHPENVAREVRAAIDRYAEDLARKVGAVVNPRWFGA